MAREEWEWNNLHQEMIEWKATAEFYEREVGRLGAELEYATGKISSLYALSDGLKQTLDQERRAALAELSAHDQEIRL